MKESKGTTNNLLTFWVSVVKLLGVTNLPFGSSLRNCDIPERLTTEVSTFQEAFQVSSISYSPSVQMTKKTFFLDLQKGSQFWSILMIFIYLILAVMNAALILIKMIKGDISFRNTLEGFHTIVTVVTVGTFLILILYIVSSNGNLNAFTCRLESVTQGIMAKSGWKCHKLFSVGVFALSCMELTLLCEMIRNILHCRDCWCQFHYLTEFLDFMFIKLFIATYSLGCYMIACSFSVVLKAGNDTVKRVILENRFTTDIRSMEQINKHNEKWAETYKGKLSGLKSDVTMRFIAATEAESAKLLQEEVTLFLYRNVRDLALCQEVANRYFSLPLFTIFTVLVTYTLLTLFNFVTKGLTSGTFLRYACFPYNSFMLLILCCAPGFVKTQVRLQHFF